MLLLQLLNVSYASAIEVLSLVVSLLLSIMAQALKNDFDVDRDIPDLFGKVILITGGELNVAIYFRQCLISAQAMPG